MIAVPLSGCSALLFFGVPTAAVIAAASMRGGSVLFRDDFSSYDSAVCLSDGAELGPWNVRFAGFGCVSVGHFGESSVIALRPDVARQPSETHAALIVGPRVAAPFHLTAEIRSPQRLRRGSPPNPWEVAWVVWSFTDEEHFYYFIAKPAGWEIGKRDPSYPGGQRFLATGSERGFSPDEWLAVRIEQSEDAEISVWVDDQFIARIRDRERPYGAGRIGFYTEDAEAHIRNVVVRR